MIAQPVPCAPVPMAGQACGAVVDLVTPDSADGLLGNVMDGGLLGRGVDAVEASIGDTISGWFLDGAAWFLGKLWELVVASSAIRLDSAWFTEQYARVGEVAVPLGLMMLFFAIIAARGDAAEIAASAFLHLPGAIVLGAVAIPIVTIGVALTDAVTHYLLADVQADVDAGMTELTANLAVLGGDGTPPIVAGVAGLLIMVAIVIAWAWLQIQAVAIYLCVVFLPVMFVMRVHRSTRSWAPRIGWMLLALLISKPVLVVCLGLGVAALSGSGQGEAYAGVFQGALTMGVAALSPAAVLAFVPAAASAGRATRGPRTSTRRIRSSAGRAKHAVANRRSRTVDAPAFRASANPAPAAPPPPRTPPPPRPTPRPRRTIP